MSRRAVLRIALSALFVVGLVWLVHTTGLRAIAERLRHVAWPLAAAAVAVQLAPLTVARALRWRALLPPHGGLATLSAVLLGSQALSNVLPLRAGEAYRTVALHRRGFAIERVIAAQAAEKVVEAASVAAFAIPVLATPGLFPWARRAAVVAGAFAAAIVVAAVVLHALRRRHGAFARILSRAIETLRSPAAWAKSFAFALVADALDVAIVALSARAVGMPLSFVRCAAVLVFVNLAVIIPAAPGQIGTLEAGAVGALVALGRDPDSALAFALLYHAVHVVPATIVGGLVLAAARRPHAAVSA